MTRAERAEFGKLLRLREALPTVGALLPTSTLEAIEQIAASPTARRALGVA